MIISKIRSSVILLGCLLAASAAQAVTLTGGISLTGSFTTNTGDVNTATGFTSFTGVTPTTTGGTFTAIPVFTPGNISMVGFNFGTTAAPALSGLVNPLWTWTSGPNTISFNLNSVTTVDHVPVNSVSVVGAGLFNGTVGGVVYEPTNGTFLLTANQGGGTISFSSSQAAVPDGGSSSVLLGLALVGIALVSRRLKRS
jgi:hypothetical protein